MSHAFSVTNFAKNSSGRASRSGVCLKTRVSYVCMYVCMYDTYGKDRLIATYSVVANLPNMRVVFGLMVVVHVVATMGHLNR